MAKLFSRGQKEEKKAEAKPKTRQLWGVDFSIVGNGLDEEQVVSFVNELIRQFESSTPSSVRSILRSAIAEAEKIVATMKTRASVEAQEEADRILADANKKASAVVREAQAAGAVAVESSLETAGELLSQAVGEKVGRETVDYSQMGFDGQTPFAGEVELAIDVPVDLKMVSELYSNLQTIPELRILNTRGSATRGTVITVVLNKPLPLISLIASKMPDIELVPDVPKKGGSKSGLPGQGKKAVARRIKLIQKA